jgi:hypothetical protein
MLFAVVIAYKTTSFTPYEIQNRWSAARRWWRRSLWPSFWIAFERHSWAISPRSITYLQRYVVLAYARRVYTLFYVIRGLFLLVRSPIYWGMLCLLCACCANYVHAVTLIYLFLLVWSPVHRGKLSYRKGVLSYACRVLTLINFQR